MEVEWSFFHWNFPQDRNLFPSPDLQGYSTGVSSPTSDPLNFPVVWVNRHLHYVSEIISGQCISEIFWWRMTMFWERPKKGRIEVVKKKHNHIHKVPSKKMFCVRNSPTLTPSHSWKQLWTKQSPKTKGWNMLKNNRKMHGKGNSSKMRISCLCSSVKPPTFKTTSSPLIETVSKPSILGLHS